jgi:DNA repair protein RadC
MPHELAHCYPLIEEQVAATGPPNGPLAAEAFSKDKGVRRFFRRLGVLPRGGRGASASRTLLDVVDVISRTTGTEADRARAVLAAYCRADGGLTGALCGDTPRCDRCPLVDQCPFPSRRPTIKELPESERPRERLAQLGAENLTDAELLAILIGGGTVEVSAVELARSLIVRFGGFRALAECSPAQLQQVRGIGEAKAASIKAATEIAKRFRTGPPSATPGAFLNPEAVHRRYGVRLGTERRETFVVLLLDAKNRLIRDVTISQGSLTQSIVHPREVFEPAIRDSAASVIFVHNHPSGDTSPSREDIEITGRLKKTGEIIGVRVLDHVVVSETEFTSLAEKGLL